jgi:hypothetical protein
MKKKTILNFKIGHFFLSGLKIYTFLLREYIELENRKMKAGPNSLLNTVQCVYSSLNYYGLNKNVLISSESQKSNIFKKYLTISLIYLSLP